MRDDGITAVWALMAQAIMIAIAYPTACLAGASLAELVFAQAHPVLGPNLNVAATAFADLMRLWWVAGVTALVPAIVMVVLFEGLKVRGLLPHLVAGCLVGFVRALPLGAMVVTGEADGTDIGPAQLSVAAGALGGLIYWAIAGRTAGRWLERRWFAPQGR